MAEFKGNVNLLKSRFASKLYAEVKDLPIIDYHCHLSPKEIYDDLPFTDIGEMWLGGDHYKWRLMRAVGVDERYITGDATSWEKFYQFAKVLGSAYGNPIRDWCAMELSFFFGIDTPLNEGSAKEIWDRANKVILTQKLSPRKLIQMANVEYIATTDDMCDGLDFHDLLAGQAKLKAKVVPSFRVDNLILARDKNYKQYIDKLSSVSCILVEDIASLEEAVTKRLNYFVARGCKFADVGVEGFPKSIANRQDADSAFKKLIAGECVSDSEYDGFLGYLYAFLAKIYAEKGVVMQLHLAVTRNCNTLMYNSIGKDSGFDCVGDMLEVKYIKNLLDALNSEGALPKTIIYTLNPTMYYPLTTMCGAFGNKVVMGISWWFCDHKRGMYETLQTVSELSHISSLVGMLTDSRSFLSYTRHDYYRRIVCDFLGSCMSDENDIGAVEVAKALCYGNAKKLVEE